MFKNSNLFSSGLSDSPLETEFIVLDKDGYCSYASGKYRHLKDSEVSQFESIPFFQSSKITWGNLKDGQSVYYPCVSLGDTTKDHFDVSVKKEYWDEEEHYICLIKDQTDHYQKLQKLQQTHNEKRISAETKPPGITQNLKNTTLHKVLFKFEGGYKELQNQGIFVQSMIGDHYSCTLTQELVDNLYQIPGVRIIALHPPIY